MEAQREEEWISIHDVAKAMGIELTDRQAWGLGRKLAEDYWRASRGNLPVKDLRGKKKRGGSHCFAIYPKTWWPIIERRIRALFSQRSLW